MVFDCQPSKTVVEHDQEHGLPWSQKTWTMVGNGDHGQPWLAMVTKDRPWLDIVTGKNGPWSAMVTMVNHGWQW
ncbi:hypothetical protein DPMN_023439 [Dreissena polymorpha]|uniref:Uncharacterized protein n=1 Tax=Dreissena polymorpha TaxID=45954 RepID=A0A9D4LMX7_DREPO|nr:hypothetical protein DPMN_023439 [Dreissena polymorpha]